ncbi:MAG: ABC transporter substrate-binding protein [Janthinobacterium lividum]
MNTLSRYSVLLMVASTLLLAGCGSKPDVPTVSAAALPAAFVDRGGPITIGYSDWPGWTCWDIAEQQGFFRKHHVNVKLVWFPSYTDSLNALAAGQVDANCQTWSDTMGPLASGQPLKAVLINDNSAGNDAVLADAGISSIKALRGKKVATELGTVEQFLLDQALAANGMTEKDIHYVNIKVQDCPGAMIAHKVDAIAVWEPNKTQLLDNMPGTHVIFDSKSLPGLIPDLLVFQTAVVDQRPQEIQNIVDAWYDMMGWWRAHPKQAVQIMAARTKSKADFYQKFILGTRIFDASEAVSAFRQSRKPTSLYRSGEQSGQFLLGQGQIPKVPDYSNALDPQFVKAAALKGEGKQPPYDYTLKVD